MISDAEGGVLEAVSLPLEFNRETALNVGAKRISVRLADITDVRPAQGKLVRRFEVVEKASTHSFLVENREQWLAAFTPLLGVRGAS